KSNIDLSSDGKNNLSEETTAEGELSKVTTTTTTTVAPKRADTKLETTATTIKADKPVEVKSIDAESDARASDIIKQNDLIIDDGAIIDVIADDRSPVVKDLSGDNNN
ncbi:MAG TPA: hypothetical protein PLI57_11710, partial [Spirochaetota bacterium]|nr:hypothetical protein [Spirochaetota bacterium]